MYDKTEQLGLGAYTVADVSRLVGMHYSTARSWYISRSRGSSSVLHSDFPRVSGDFAVSFLDLMDANAVKQLRHLKVPLSVIRKAYQMLSEKLNTQHPFAHSDIYTNGEKIIVGMVDKVGSPALEDAIDHQGFFFELRCVLSRVNYDPKTGIALRWPIYDDVLIDPKVAYGKPAIVGTATKTSIVANQYYANDRNAGLIADLYSISEPQVLNAVRFEQSIRTPMAA